MPDMEKAVNVSTGETVVTPRTTNTEAYVDALYRERAGYERRGLSERIADVDAEIDRYENGDQDPGPFDPAAHNQADVLAYLGDVTEAEAVRVLDAEAGGQNRKKLAEQRDDILAQARDRDQQ